MGGGESRTDMENSASRIFPSGLIFRGQQRQVSPFMTR